MKTLWGTRCSGGSQQAWPPPGLPERPRLRQHACRVEPRNASAAPICAAGYYTCASCCDQDADCNCDGHGGDAYDHAWRTPKCPEGYYECGDCCDRDADCACDDQCERFRAPSCFRRERYKNNNKQYRPCNSDLPANVDCSLAALRERVQAPRLVPRRLPRPGPAATVATGTATACDGAWRTGNFNGANCGPGRRATARSGLRRVHKASTTRRSRGAVGHLATEAGARAGPNETAAARTDTVAAEHALRLHAARAPSTT